MTHEEILKEITSLPLEGQRQVIDFIAFVRQRYSQTQLNEKASPNIATEGFVGMWQDRDDLKDSSLWVRSIRDQCATARVPFFFKQWGGVRKSETGRELDGSFWDELPSLTNNPVPSVAERKRTLESLAV